jgi:CRP-like cAMP-binding protein
VLQSKPGKPIVYNPLTAKLEQFTSFTPEELKRLDQILAGERVLYPAKATIIADGEKVTKIHLVVSGLAARSKHLDNGDRQIMAFLVPGDLCDVEVFVLEAMDHEILAISDTECVLIPSDVVKELLTEMSGLTKGLWWSTMSDAAVLRERIIDHGRRNARERLAHLFYEMLIRYRVVGQTSDNSFPFAVTQEELADATGLTPVHVNRTLQELRAEGLIEFRNKVLTIANPRGLKKAARFEAEYLHFKRLEEGRSDVVERAGDLI